MITTTLGFPLTLKAAIILPFLTAGMVIGGAICTTAIVGLVVLAARMIRDRCSIQAACHSLFRDGIIIMRDKIQRFTQEYPIDGHELIEELNKLLLEIPNPSAPAQMVQG